MNRWGTIVVAGAIGATVAAIYNYLFAPAPETAFDGSYRSRLDWALAEGERAAALREMELRAEFEAAKLAQPAFPAPSLPPSNPAPTPSPTANPAQPPPPANDLP